jgi:predicted RNA methylase
MKRKDVEWTLGRVLPFNKPKLSLEQYTTCPDIAGNYSLNHMHRLCYLASMIHTMYTHGDIEGRRVADFGCGTGSLTIGVAVGQPEYVLIL